MADITITEGDTLEVDYSLENTGDGTGTFDPRLLVQGVQEDQDTGITLDPAQTATGTLQWPTESGDAVTDALAEAVTDDTSDSITVTVEEGLAGYLQEEDGDITEWSGSVSRYSADSSTTSVGSSFSIGGRTDGTRNEITKPFPQTTNPFKIDLRQGPNDRADNAANNEILWRDGATDIYGLYFDLFSDGNLYWSAAGERSNGSLITSAATDTFITVGITNIDTTNETVDITVNGADEGTYNWHNSGSVPNQIALATNTGGAQSSNYFFVDNGGPV